MAGPWDNMNPLFAGRVQAFIAASGGRVKPGSGFRTVEEQVALRRTNGCPDIWTSPASSCRIPTAIPGQSNHNHGLAMDLVYTDGGKWAAANAGRFGLHFPVRGENWHVEMIDDGESHGHVMGARGRGAIGFDVSWQDEERTPQDELTHRLDQIGEIIGASPATMPTPEQMPTPTEMPSPAQMPSLDQPMAPALTMEREETGPVETTDMQVATGGEWAQGIPPPGYEPPGQGVERWRPVAEAALRYTGHEPTPQLVHAMLRRMNQESGGNPRVVNRWDSNARRGDPSTGLMQNIPSAFAQRARELSARGITDGFANMVASIRYTEKRYGDLMKGWGRRGGY